jgi:hypothetical protein
MILRRRFFNCRLNPGASRNNTERDIHGHNQPYTILRFRFIDGNSDAWFRPVDLTTGGLYELRVGIAGPLGYNSRQKKSTIGLVPGFFSIRIISLEHGRFCTVQERKKQHSLPRPPEHLLLYVLYSFLSRTDKKTYSTKDINSARSLLHIFMVITSNLNRTKFQVIVLLNLCLKTAQIFSKTF